ncbi:hypothetical protein MTX26_08355 [Bradyrhizobium sp. ISRA443]|uniref:hypothetical protein n=2 Tax=Bradyrhizobium TaxID=374 RepID=UPI00247931E4|nr:MULTISPECIES: hypothetical protein [unclassified Bradyrhizobium]WGS00824.1 hypothetical protein MTX23_08350 [Bradyrhizobium sp. ISRA436]WGS14599.1 hypothetical protein MTX26_08355 [Bradyrhizobium sp. ISRA443]
MRVIQYSRDAELDREAAAYRVARSSRAMTEVDGDAASHSRDMICRGLHFVSPSLEQRAQGKPGADRTHGSRANGKHGSVLESRRWRAAPFGFGQRTLRRRRQDLGLGGHPNDLVASWMRSLLVAATVYMSMSPALSAGLIGQASVIDGDTLDIHRTRIRLWGIRLWVRY